jgi:Transglycosylase SLT domain
VATQIQRLVIVADTQADRAQRGLRTLGRDVQQVGHVTRQTGQWFRDTDVKVAKLGDSAAKTHGPLARMGTVTEGLGFDMLSVGTASAVAGTAAVAFYKDSIGAASHLTEAQNKVNVVFGASSAGILDWGRNSAEAFGMSQRQAAEAVGTFGNLFVSMKLGQGTAADMSKRLVTLASDLASFNDASPDEALQALRSGLVGETEPLRRFGVNLNDADLRQRAMALGLTHSTKNVLPPAIRAQAAYSLILEQTKTAQGDFKRTADEAANAERTMAARTEDLKASIGKGLLPAYKELLGVANAGAGAFTKLNDATEGQVAKLLIFGPMVGLASGAYDQFNKVLHHGSDEQKRATGIGQAAAGATGLLGAKAAEAAPKIADTAHALSSYRIALHASNVELGKAIPAFEGYRREADVTGRAIVRHLREEVGAYGTWAKDTQTLIKRGASPQFIRELSQKGPAYVHAMATASDTQLALAQRFFRQRMAEIRRLSEAQLAAAGRNAPVGFAAAMTAQGGLVGRAATRTAQRAVGPFRGVRDDARSWGSGLSHNFAAGISSRSSLDAARKASQKLGISVTNLLRFSAGPTEGPLAEGGGPYVWGQHFAEKYAAGMASKYGVMSAAATGLGDAGRLPKGGSVAAIVRSIAERRGWGHGAQWAALSQLISHESGWRPTAQNPTSTAYGLFQFLNSTWAGVGGHKTSDPGLQTLYGLRYIAGRYSSPVGAWNFWQGHHWYGSGLPPTLFDKPTLIGVGERGPETVSVTPGRNPGAGAIDYDRLAAALAAQPIVLRIDNREVARAARQGGIRLAREG